MGYRTQRRFKQQQRAFADWQCDQDRKLDQHFEAVEPLTEAERASEWDDDYWQRIDAEAGGRVGEWHATPR